MKKCYFRIFTCLVILYIYINIPLEKRPQKLEPELNLTLTVTFYREYCKGDI